MNNADTFNLARFVEAQNAVYSTVLNELRNGRKQTHWMWFVFPQLKNLGFSHAAQYYGIDGLAEARAYLQHPVLRQRLEECVKTVIDCGESSAEKIFGHPDYLKFHSSMTLFARAEPTNGLFPAALAKFYNGIPDKRTEEMTPVPIP